MEPNATRSWLLPGGPMAAREARRLLSEACRDLPVDRMDDARLLVTELVSNAVRHTSGGVVLVVERDGQALRVEVLDESVEKPVVAPSQPLTDHGSGLRLVEALASSWGVAERGDGETGKRVWFALGSRS